MKGGSSLKLKDVLKAKNPVSGDTFSLFDVGTIFSMILGVMVLIFVTAAGQNAASAVSKRLPLDNTIDPFVKNNAPQIVNNKVRI
jgi:hypothetical protein